VSYFADISVATPLLLYKTLRRAKFCAYLVFTPDATDGNVRKVQKLSRHRKIDTLMIYDDNRGRDQRDISEMLDSMF